MLPKLKTSNFYDILKEVAPDLEDSSPEELQLER